MGSVFRKPIGDSSAFKGLLAVGETLNTSLPLFVFGRLMGYLKVPRQNWG